MRRAEATYRHLAFVEFGEDLVFGLNLGFYRTFAVPEIARVLASTGRMTREAPLRAKATGKAMFGLFRDGLDSDAAAEAVDALNRIHARWPIDNDAFLYVLACFDVAPMRWCDKYAWRPTTPDEKSASHVFHRRLAARMGIVDVPATWDGFARWMDDFERRRFAPTDEAAELWRATQGILAHRFPPRLAPLVRVAVDTFLDDPLRRALGVRRAPAPVRALASGGMRLRAYRIGRSHADPHYRPKLPSALRDV
ncbi:DUF2236 domain-containing protein [Yinghuangia sp. ASG 101]|uniref:oxygenase MpaB family protein n=1 Tax=Yinghuangia sp. ASG 101 TaxID=2896848 RepID=UPI001E43334F|nr:oxygenase MpaB family protein [Yinghuangia sp. ASG 101]UGQ11668.1 DUF2236 domain-containing protein [Yinghuangia sp. ASG 101]